MRHIMGGWVLAFASCLASAQTATQVRTVEGITEYALPNGLTVLLQPDASRPTTSVNLTYRVGSRHEGYGESGAAHLLEHLLFKATASVPDPKLEMTRRGARWNGTTWMDRTNYFAQFPTDAETLDWVLDWQAKAMTQARLAPEDLASELTVVRNELERAENDRGRVLLTRMQAAAYQWHAYGRDTLGAPSDVENMPMERLRAFYRKHYRPDNAVLVVGGQFDSAAVLRRIAQTFGRIPRPAHPIEATWTQEPPQDGERKVVVRRAGGTAMVGAMYHVMPASTKDYAAVQILGQALDSAGSPLHKNLVATQLAAGLWVHAFAGAEPGHFVAGVTLAALPDTEVDGAAEKAATALASMMDTLRLTGAQINDARQKTLQRIDRLLRDPEAVSLALSEAVALGDWRLLFAQREWVANTTTEDVHRVVATWLLPSNRTLGLYLPSAQTPERAPAPGRADLNALLADFKGRAIEAAPQEFELTPEAIETRLVKGQLQVGDKPGLKWVVLPRKTPGDRVTGTLRLRWGTTESLQDSWAMGALLQHVLVHRTQRRSAEQLQGALSNLDARLQIRSTAGGLTMDLKHLAKTLKP